jgi:hypothetical protein
MRLIQAYTALGAAEAPAETLETARKIAVWMQRRGYTLRTSGEPGIPRAFEAGVTWPSALEVILPESPYHGRTASPVGPAYIADTASFQAAQKLLASIENSSTTSTDDAAIAMVLQILGRDLESPSDFVVLWKQPDDRDTSGRTRTLRAIAHTANIPVWNLAIPSEAAQLRKLLRDIDLENQQIL